MQAGPGPDSPPSWTCRGLSSRRCEAGGGLCGGHPRNRDPEGRATHIVESRGVEELDARRIAAVLPADSQLQFRLCGPTSLNRDLDQFTDARNINRLEGTAHQDPLRQIARQE